MKSWNGEEISLHIKSMLLIYLISIISIVRTTNIHTAIDRISGNTNREKVFEEKCILCGKYGATVSEEIRLRNLSHLYRELDEYEDSYCYEAGYLKTFFFFEEKFVSSDNRTVYDYGIIFSIIPPPSAVTKCYINLWHEKRWLATFDIHFSELGSSKDQTPQSQQGWKIKQESVGFEYNRFHYRIFNRVFTENSYEDITERINEGKYSIQFALDEQISVHFYKTYYDNKWSGNKVASESVLDEKQYFVSSESPNITQYIIRPELSTFMDCVRYVLNPPYLDDNGIDSIGCEIYKNILRKSSPQYVRALSDVDGISTDFCFWTWNRTEELFYLSINNSYLDNIKNENSNKCDVKMALSCKLSPTHRKLVKADPNSRFLIFVTPFIHTFENKNCKSVSSLHTSSSSELHLIVSTVVWSFVGVTGVLVLILLYRYRTRLKRDNKTEYKTTEGDRALDLDKMIPFLPSWVRSDMIYHEEAIEIQQLLGRGHYGCVYKGLFRNGKAVWTIALKTLRTKKENEKNGKGSTCLDSSTSGYQSNEACDEEENLSLLMDEAKTMMRVGEYHENIVNLQGMIVKLKDDLTSQMSLILEYCSQGNLRDYLHKNFNEFNNQILNCQKGDNANLLQDTTHHNLSLLLRWSYQVACGMEFISKKHIYHGDLATRNILLTDQLVAKVSDFGLSQRLYQSIPPNTSYSGDVGCVKLPIKWLALEVLMHGQATTKSDVWSYGVLVWEILNFGEEPYSPGISYEELKNNLLNGFRLTNPKYSPPEISHMVQTCWLPDPKERPTFTTLKQIAWESVFASQRESEGAINIFSSTVSINKRPNRRYKKMRKCSYVDQKHKSLGKDKWETKCESGNSMVTQCYADLDLALLKNVPKNDSVINQSIIQSCEKEKEEMDIRKVPDKSDELEDITMNGHIKLEQRNGLYRGKNREENAFSLIDLDIFA